MVLWGRVTSAPRVVTLIAVDPAGIAALQDAIRRMEGCDSVHRQTVPVELRTPDGREVVWNGDVEIFTLTNHPKKVYRAYAWSEAITGTQRRLFVVPHSAEAEAPHKAVEIIRRSLF